MLDVLLSWTGWDRTSMATGGTEIYMLDGSPPDKLCLSGQTDGRLEILFCHEGEFMLEFSNGSSLSLRAGGALFLSDRVRDGLFRFSQQRFQGVLVQEDKRCALTRLTSIHPELTAADSACPLQSLPGCAVLENALWCDALFGVLDCLPTCRQGSYCALKTLELLYLLRAGEPVLNQPSPTDYRDRHQIQTAKEIHDYMLKHLDQRLTIQQLAIQFHVSSTTLKNCFRQLYGIPIHQYLLRHRMAQAAQLLSSTDQSIVQIAAAVGYGSVSQFGSVFKAHYQLSPAQYRRSAKKMSITALSCPNQSENLMLDEL